jgi:predicted nuclease of predicted toxin-antitoxin system
MKLVADENIKSSITDLLVQEGHEVVRVQDVELGISDREVIEYCRAESRVLLTNDDDFFDFDSHPGTLFLTHQTTSAREVVNAIRHIERQLSADDLSGIVLHVPDGWV